MLIPTKFPLSPFTPLHRSTFGRLPEQEGEGKAARERGAGEGLWGRGFSFGEGLSQKQLSRYSQRAAAQCLCLTKNNFLYR